MTEIRFYHLQTQSLEQALPQILSKAYATGKPIFVKLPKEAVSRVNDILWTYRADSFLPHGTVKDGHKSLQPIFLSDEDDAPNDARILVTGLGAVPANPEQYDLCCEMLDGHDQDNIQAARTRWKDYKDKGFEVTYWQQTPQGGWDKKA